MNKIILSFLLLFISYSFAIPQSDPWKQVPKILKHIKEPKFQKKDFNIVKFGAVGDNKTDCTEAFRQAIEKCSASGGGRVIVPEGKFLTGAIHLKSNVNLHLMKNSVIAFSTDPAKYLPLVYTRWEGVECMNYSACIYAYGQKNIAVTGEGLLDGQGSKETWWSWKQGKSSEQKQNPGRVKLFKWGEDNTPVEQRVLGEGYYMRPNFFQPYKCENVLVEGVKFINSPMWFMNPVLCKNVIFKNMTVEGLGPNNDGCDPESCTDVLIKGCFFNTGDDCIAIKSGRNNDGRRLNVPTENVIIQDCVMQEGHGGVVIGSEISGSVRNVFAENCKMSSPNLDRALRIKTNATRGGTVENIHMRNVKVGEVKEAVVLIDFYYEEGDKGDFTPVVRNVSVKNVSSEKSKYAIWAKAYERSPVTGLVIENCKFMNVKEKNVLENVDKIKIKRTTINGEVVSSI